MNGPYTPPESRDPESGNPESPDPESPDAAPPVEGSPPLGSWARLYALVVIAAVAVMAFLYWFTQTYDVPMGAR